MLKKKKKKKQEENLQVLSQVAETTNIVRDTFNTVQLLRTHSLFFYLFFFFSVQFFNTMS